MIQDFPIGEDIETRKSYCITNAVTSSDTMKEDTEMWEKEGDESMLFYYKINVIPKEEIISNNSDFTKKIKELKILPTFFINTKSQLARTSFGKYKYHYFLEVTGYFSYNKKFYKDLDADVYPTFWNYSTLMLDGIHTKKWLVKISKPNYEKLKKTILLL